MTSFMFTFVFFIVVIALMALGVMMKRKAIQGSCGGLASVDVERVCHCETACDVHQKNKRLYQITEPAEDEFTIP